MPSHPKPPSRALIGRQKAAAERLRRELLGPDRSVSSPYFRDLHRQIRDFERPSELAELFDVCGRRDLVYVGDFHAVPGFQRFTAELLERMSENSRKIALGVEFVYTRQQRVLDRRQAGIIDDETFRRRIHYREEWGYPWEGYQALLDRAKERRIPVHALDVQPRGGVSGLPRRDRHAARRIASIVAEDPGRKMLVLFGESHVSAGHLPRRVSSALGRLDMKRTHVSVFQDPDPIYWKLVSQGGPLPRVVKLVGDAYGVLHGSPLVKYEAYRQVLERWRDDVPPEEEVDLSPAVYHLIEVLLGWLGIRANRHRLRHRDGWSEELVDAFPEVHGGPEGRLLLGPILLEHRRTPEEILEAKKLLAREGALYDSRSNTLFLLRYLPARAAGEGARFVRAALSGRLFDSGGERWPDPVARAYGAAYDEGLAVLGSLLVDPTRDVLGAVPWTSNGPPDGPSADESRESGCEREQEKSWLDAHRRFEGSRRLRLPERLAGPLGESRPLRRALARDLGQRLGRTLFERVRQDRLDARGLRALFRRSLAADNAQRVVLRLLRG